MILGSELKLERQLALVIIVCIYIYVMRKLVLDFEIIGINFSIKL